MRRIRRVRRGAVGAVALAALASGCVGGPAPRDHFYRLEVAAPGSSLSQPVWDGTLDVDRPRTDALTRERAILYRTASDPEEVQRYGYQNWVDSPTRLIQQQLVAYLRAAGAAGQVVTPEMRVPARFDLSSRLIRLEHVRGSSSRVVVELEFVVAEHDSRKLLLRETYREDREPQGGDIADVVIAFEAALHSIFARLVADAAG